MAPPIEACATVTEISSKIGRRLWNDREFHRIRVRGETFDVKIPTDKSKPLYFRLKCEDDQKCTLSAVWFPGDRKEYFTHPKNELLAVVEGRITTFDQNSSYQIRVERIIPVGVEDPQTDRKERWLRLNGEGLFNKEKKRPIPYLPEHIGVVCSPTSAAYSDIQRWLSDYYPSRYELILKPVRVQGDDAAAEIAAAIEGIMRESPRPEVVIVARGGGTEEDLSVFDEEEVVRAAARCEVPLISGVGHDPDEPLIDFAADLRVPTPTAAAAVLQLEDRRRAGEEFSSEAEAEYEETSQEGDSADWSCRLDEIDKRLEDIQKVVNESSERLDELETDTESPRRSRAGKFLAVAAFIVLSLLVLVAVLWPNSDTWAQWPELCNRYIGWVPLCK